MDPKTKAQEPEDPAEEQEELLDEAIEESFPASDPPATGNFT